MLLKKFLVNMDLLQRQKVAIVEFWDERKNNPPSLKEIIGVAFPGEDIDSRSVKGRAVRDFLSSMSANYKTTDHINKPRPNLTEENKEFIKNNLSSLRIIEMARIIYNNERVQPLGMEVKVVNEYVKYLVEESKKRVKAKREAAPKSEEDEFILKVFEKSDIPDGDYVAPLQLPQIVTLVNRHTQQNIEYKSMSLAMRRNMEGLRGFLQSPRFIHMINSYSAKASRDIFESEFVRAVWDKPDLTADELNLYVNLSSLYVSQIRVNGQMDLLNEKYNAAMNGDDRMSMTLSDMIKVKTDELNRILKSQSDLIETLNGKRADRKKAQKGGDMNIAKLIEWWRDKNERDKAIQMAEIQMKDLETEVKRYESASDICAKIYGLSFSELSRG
jgi:hypothetical protein